MLYRPGHKQEHQRSLFRITHGRIVACQGTQKPGFPLQFLRIAPQFLRDFRCNPLRGKGLVQKQKNQSEKIQSH
jgi:hypothetical protein